MEISSSSSYTIKCLDCDSKMEVRYWHILDKQEYPDLWELCRNGDIHSFRCPKGHEFSISVPILVHNGEKRLIVCIPSYGANQQQTENFIQDYLYRIHRALPPAVNRDYLNSILVVEAGDFKSAFTDLIPQNEGVIFSDLCREISTLTTPESMAHRILLIENALKLIDKTATQYYGWLLGMLGNSYFKLQNRNEQDVENAIKYVKEALDFFNPTDNAKAILENTINISIFYAHRSMGNKVDNLSIAVDYLYSIKTRIPQFYADDAVQTRISKLENERSRYATPEKSYKPEITVNELFQKLDELEQKYPNDFEPCIQLLNQHIDYVDIEQDPQTIGMVHFRLATYLMSGGIDQLEEAIVELEFCLSIFPETNPGNYFSVIQSKLAETYFTLSRVTKNSLYLDKARLVYEAIRSDKDLPEELFFYNNLNLSICYAERKEGTREENFYAALHYAQKAEAFIHESAGFSPEVTYILATLFDQFKQVEKNNARQAISYYKKALSGYETYHTDYERILPIYILLIDLYDNLENVEEDELKNALDIWDRLLHKLDRNQQPEQWGELHIKGANLMSQFASFNRSYAAKAVHTYYLALSIFQQSTHPKKWADIQVLLGAVHREYGDAEGTNFENSIAYYTAALAVFTLEKYPDEYYTARFSLAIIYRMRQQGDRDDNIAQATTILLNLTKLIPKSYVNLMISILKELGIMATSFRDVRFIDYKRAESFLLKALALCTDSKEKKIDLTRELGQLYLKWSFIHRELNEKSIDCFRNALVDFDTIANKDSYLNQLLLGDIYLKLGDAYMTYSSTLLEDHIELAIDSYKEALLTTKTSDSRDNRYRYSMFCWKLARAFGIRKKGLDTDNKQQALYYYRQMVGYISDTQFLPALTTRISTKEHYIYIYDYSKLLVELTYWKEAYTILKEVLTSTEKLFNIELGEVGQTNFLQTNYVYDRLILVCFKLGEGYYEEAFDYLERNKSRLFREQVGLLELPYPDNIPKEAKEKERELRVRYAGLYEILSYSNRSNDIEALKKTKEQLHLLWSDWQLRYMADEYVSLRRGDAASFQDIYQWLQSVSMNVGFLVFCSLESITLAFVLQKASPSPVVFPIHITALELKKMENQLKKELQFSPVRTEAWKALSPYLVSEDVVDKVKTLDCLYIIPTGKLHGFPIHALEFNQKALIDYVPVMYAPSCSIALRINKKPKRSIGSNLLLVGNPMNNLPFSELESLAIANLFHAHPLIGSFADKKKVLEAIGTADLIHIAAHAFFDRENPFDSGLQLAHGDILTARELSTSQLTAGLVAISACQSGAQDVRYGDELYGFARALLYAGVPTLLLSLWEINDEFTGEFMTRFYRNMLDNTKNDQLSLVKAFQRTIRSFSEEATVSSSFWAPFFLYGGLA